MDRLTMRLNTGIAKCAEESTDLCYAQEECYGCCHHSAMIERLVAYEDTGLEPEEVRKIMDAYAKTFGKGVSFDRIQELIQAEKDGRLVVLPFPVHSTLVNMFYLNNPELLKDFRISATWTHRGIVFHMPWGIFSERVNAGIIDRVSQEAEAALKESTAASM